MVLTIAFGVAAAALLVFVLGIIVNLRRKNANVYSLTSTTGKKRPWVTKISSCWVKMLITTIRYMYPDSVKVW